MNGTQILFDRESTDGAEYVGVAASGTNSTEAKWQIKKVTIDSEEKPLKIQYANGKLDFAFKWSERTTLTFA